MVLQAGAVLARPGYIKLKLNWINVFVACMFFANSRDNAMPYFSLLEILTLENIYKFKVALFAHKITNNTSNVPTIFKGTLTLASEVHSYNTRFVSKHNFYRPRIRNSYGAATFAFAGSKVWENIPSKLKTLPYNNFYEQYKLYLLTTQWVIFDFTVVTISNCFYFFFFIYEIVRKKICTFKFPFSVMHYL